MKKFLLSLAVLLAAVVSANAQQDRSPAGPAFSKKQHVRSNESCKQQSSANSFKFVVDTIPSVFGYVSQVDTNILLGHIRHLQDFGTRYSVSSQAFEAQDWIKTQFESYGLTAELQDFFLWAGNSSDNVIATLPGTLYPDEYVIIGGHYDSYATMSIAPGADDNASGTGGVLEAARILSQYEFQRTLVFIAFSGEEEGLYGSEEYASQAEADGMNILGYVNLDMIGYLEPGTDLHAVMIAPPSAKELADYYIAMAGIYVPDLEIWEGALSGGDSDHSSFNDHGYMGIFPFEDDELYSPYIHTFADTIGTSYISNLLALSLTRAAVATIASLAVPVDQVGIAPPDAERQFCTVYPNPADHQVFVGSLRPGGRFGYRLLNPAGLLISEGEGVYGKSIPLSGTSTGLYFLKIEDEYGTRIKKVICR